MKAIALLDIINFAICTLICLRLLAYRKQGAQHHSLASLLAYIIIITSGGIAIRSLFGLHEANLYDLVMNAVLCLAIFAAKGNVVDLFRTADGENAISKLIRRINHAAS